MCRGCSIHNYETATRKGARLSKVMVSSLTFQLYTLSRILEKEQQAISSAESSLCIADSKGNE